MATTTADQKLWFLDQIKHKKDLLLGAFDDSKGITRDNQRKAWDDLFLKCRRNDIPFAKSDHKSGNGKYLRDQVFGRWRRDCLEKRDKCRK